MNLLRRPRLRTGIAAFLLALRLACPAKNTAQITQIPSTHGTTLAGENVTLPDVFRGKIGVLVLGFSRSSRDTASAWEHRLAADYLSSPDVLYYEVALLEDAPRLVRPMILHSMRSSMPEPTQARFLPVTEKEEQWRALVHFDKSKPDDPYIVLTDGSGHVFWQTRGPASDTAYAGLRQQLDDLRSSKPFRKP